MVQTCAPKLRRAITPLTSTSASLAGPIRIVVLWYLVSTSCDPVVSKESELPFPPTPIWPLPLPGVPIQGSLSRPILTLGPLGLAFFVDGLHSATQVLIWAWATFHFTIMTPYELASSLGQGKKSVSLPPMPASFMAACHCPLYLNHVLSLYLSPHTKCGEVITLINIQPGDYLARVDKVHNAVAAKGALWHLPQTSCWGTYYQYLTCHPLSL